MPYTYLIEPTLFCSLFGRTSFIVARRRDKSAIIADMRSDGATISSAIIGSSKRVPAVVSICTTMKIELSLYNC